MYVLNKDDAIICNNTIGTVIYIDEEYLYCKFNNITARCKIDLINKTVFEYDTIRKTSIRVKTEKDLELLKSYTMKYDVPDDSDEITNLMPNNKTCTLYKREECIGVKNECTKCQFYVPAPNGKEHKKPGETTDSLKPLKIRIK